LLHNAFVSDPAYVDSRVIEHHHRRRAPRAGEESERMSDRDGGGAPDQAARIDELEGALTGALAQIDALKAALEVRETEVFEAAFGRAVAAGRILPAKRAQFEAIRKAAGLDAVVSLFEAYPDQAAVPTRPVGVGATADQPKTTPDAAALAQQILRAGRKENQQ
jgi:phage I-like protein